MSIRGGRRVNKRPLLSVITVTRNAETVLPVTLASVRRQRFSAFELIVIDGASTDDTVSVIEKNRDIISSYLSEPDEGIYDAMNKGLDMAAGEFVCFLNAGDRFSGGDTLRRIFTDPSVVDTDLIYGDARLMDGDFQPVRVLPAGKLTGRRVRKGMIVCHQSMFVRRAIAPRYDTRLRYKAELNWLLDIMAAVDPERIQYHPVPVADYMLGGFSQRYFWPNFKELVSLLHRRFGWPRSIRNAPRYTRLFLGFYLRKLFRVHTFRFWERRGGKS